MKSSKLSGLNAGVAPFLPPCRKSDQVEKRAESNTWPQIRSKMTSGNTWQEELEVCSWRRVGSTGKQGYF